VEFYRLDCGDDGVVRHTVRQHLGNHLRDRAVHGHDDTAFDFARRTPATLTPTTVEER
jgi:hypothetical protein